MTKPFMYLTEEQQKALFQEWNYNTDGEIEFEEWLEQLSDKEFDYICGM